MKLDTLACPNCQGRLRQRGDALDCSGCERIFAVREGIPSFGDPSLYWGEIDYDHMRRTNRLALEKGWETAVEEVVRPLQADRSIGYVVDDNRADWRFALPSMANWRILDLGAGWGPLTFALAKASRKVVALEGVWERARFMEIRRVQSHVSNVEVIHADAYHLPFASETFDLAVVNGLLEWVALWNTQGKPRDIQKAFLARVRRILRPGGWLYVGIENRIGEGALRGGRDHSGFPYTMLMPRPFADWYIRQKHSDYRTEQRNGYRTYTYSYWGYLRLFHESGFGHVRAYWPIPGYNMPRNMVPLQSESVAAFYLRPPAYRQTPKGRLLRLLKRVLAQIGGGRIMASNFSFFARKV